MASHDKKSTTMGKDWGLIWGGVLVFLLGVVCFVWPGLPMVTIVMIAGAALIAAGVFDILSWIRSRKLGQASGWTLATGICNIVLGLLFIAHPIVASDVIITLVGWLMIIYGAFGLASAFGLRSAGSFWAVMCAMGIVSLVCGIMFLLAPAFFMFFLGAMLLMRGITMVCYGIVAPQDLKF